MISQPPFNKRAHEDMLRNGYEYEHYPESWEDVGDGESGPRLIGGPAFDVYQNGVTEIIVSHEGLVVAMRPYEEPPGFAFEDFVNPPYEH